jgi:hypothetical protein
MKVYTVAKENGMVKKLEPYNKDLESKVPTDKIDKLSDMCRLFIYACMGQMGLQKEIEELTNRDLLNILEKEYEFKAEIKQLSEDIWVVKKENKPFGGRTLSDALLFALDKLYHSNNTL